MKSVKLHQMKTKQIYSMSKWWFVQFRSYGHPKEKHRDTPCGNNVSIHDSFGSSHH